MNVQPMGAGALNPAAIAASRAEIARNAERLAAEAARKRVQRHLRKGGVLVREGIAGAVRWISASRSGDPFDPDACETLLASGRLAPIATSADGTAGSFRGPGQHVAAPDPGRCSQGRSEVTGGPLFHRLELPALEGRWTARRKEEVVSAIARGILTPEEALDRYRLSAGELRSWRAALRQHGPKGLSAKRLQEARP